MSRKRSCVCCHVQGAATASGAAPLELSFLESYGQLAHHLWFGDGFVMVGFKSGQVVVVSSLR
jgi:WD repeat-containing protein 19